MYRNMNVYNETRPLPANHAQESSNNFKEVFEFAKADVHLDTLNESVPNKEDATSFLLGKMQIQSQLIGISMTGGFDIMHTRPVNGYEKSKHRKVEAPDESHFTRGGH